MTNDLPGAPAAGSRVPAAVLITVGTLSIVGGVVVVAISKSTADQALHAGSSTTAVLAVGVNSGYLFPAAGPDYAGAWIGLAAVIVGILAVAIGLIGAYRRRTG